MTDATDVNKQTDVESEDEGPKTLPGQLYDMRVPKGWLGDLQISLWDKVRDCSGEDCKLFDTCPYFQDKSKINKAKKAKEEGKNLGICRVEQKYLHYNLKPFWGLLQKVPDEFVMQTVGMHLIPLYHDLIILKMEKAALKSVTYSDSKGTKRIEPVFDQLLKIHKEIMNTWKNSGLLALAKDVGFFKKGGNILPSDDDLLMHGDADAYDAMASGVDNK